MLFQQRLAGIRIEVFCLALVDVAVQTVFQSFFKNGIPDTLAILDNFGRRETTQFRSRSLGIRANGYKECAGGDVTKCQTVLFFIAVKTCHVIILVFVQHTAFGDSTGGDDPGNATLDDALSLGGVFHLLTDGYFITSCHQTGDIGIHRVGGYATHGSLLLLGFVPVPGGQQKIQFLCGDLGVLVEHLIEIAQPEEQNAILVIRFDLVILTLHWRHFVFLFRHFILPFRQVFR